LDALTPQKPLLGFASFPFTKQKAASNAKGYFPAITRRFG
jgi:hypothetical protein